MARRNRKQGNSLAVPLLTALCIYLFFELIKQGIPLIFLMAIVVGVIVAAAVVHPARSRRRLFDKANTVIEQNADQLAKRRAQLVRHDPYGKVLLEKWHAEIDYFIAEHIRPRLAIKEQAILDRNRGEIARMVMLRAEQQTQQSPVFKAFSETMTPIEFEAFCAEQLREAGWDTRLTRTTGDQGVDVIAEKNGVRVALQCKKYSGSVGNDAVMAIVAGGVHERAQRCAVVTNSRYTASAQELAGTNGVLLLHYSELPNLDVLLERRFPESSAHAYTPDLFAPAPDVDASGPTADEVPLEHAPTAVATQPSRGLDKRYVVAAGIVIVAIAVMVLLSMSMQQQKSVTSDTRANTTDTPRKRRAAAPEFTTYADPKFGFRIGYPTIFVPKDGQDGDIITFVSPDGAATLATAGANTDGFTINDLYNTSLKGVKGELGYTHLGGTWFVVSWKEGDRVYYQKVFAGSGSQNWFTFTFPENQRSTYEQIVTRIEKSFRPGDLDQVK